MFMKKEKKEKDKKEYEAEEDEDMEADIMETKTKLKGNKSKNTHTIQLTDEEMRVKINDLIEDEDRKLYLRIQRGSRVQDELEQLVNEVDN